MDYSDKDFFEKKQNRLVSPLIRRGIISRVNLPSWTADVQLIGGTSTVIKNVQMSSAVPVSISVGDKCLVSTQTENVSEDCVILCLYGKRIPPNVASSGFATIPVGNHNPVPHSLGITPNIISVSTFVGGLGAGGGQPAYVWVSTTNPQADSTNIYIDNGGTGAGARSTYWAAAYIGQ